MVTVLMNQVLVVITVCPLTIPTCVPDAVALLLETSVTATALLMMLHKLMEKIIMMLNCPHLKDKRKKFLI